MATEKETTPGAGEAREIVGKAVEAGRAYAEAAGTAAVAGLKTAFALQGDAIAAGRAVADATIDASRTLADRWTAAVREGQATATELAESSARIALRTFDTKSDTKPDTKK